MSILKANRIENLTTTAGGINVDNSGRIGIGTASPSYTTHINSSGATSLGVTTSSGSSEPQILLEDTSASDYFALQKNGRALLFKPQGSEKCRITSDGLTFNGDTAATNALDDYEEGTWTPNVGGNATYDIQWGYYVKVGAMVHCWGALRTQPLGTGDARKIKGLPFTAINTPSSTQTGGGAVVWHDNAPANLINTPAIAVTPNTTEAQINAKTSGSANLQSNQDFWQNNHRANFFITYRITL